MCTFMYILMHICIYTSQLLLLKGKKEQKHSKVQMVPKDHPNCARAPWKSG